MSDSTCNKIREQRFHLFCNGIEQFSLRAASKSMNSVSRFVDDSLRTLNRLEVEDVCYKHSIRDDDQFPWTER